MKKVLGFIIFTLFFCYGNQLMYAQDTACSNFKKGIFRLSNTDTGKIYLIKRSKNYQIEQDLDTGDKNKFKIEWIDDCSFTLRFINGTESTKNFFQEKLLIVEIHNTGTDTYECTSRMEDSEKTINNSVVRIR